MIKANTSVTDVDLTSVLITFVRGYEMGMKQKRVVQGKHFSVLSVILYISILAPSEYPAIYVCVKP